MTWRVMSCGAINVKNSTIFVKMLHKIMVFKLLRAYIPLKLYYNARNVHISLKFHTQKSLTVFLVLIVVVRNVRNGKSNLDKKRCVVMNNKLANKKSFLTKQNKKWNLMEVDKSNSLVMVAIPITLPKIITTAIIGNRAHLRLLAVAFLKVGDQHRPHLITSEELTRT